MFQREFDYHNLFKKSLFISNFRPLGLLQETILFKKNYIFSLLSSTILVWHYDNAKGDVTSLLVPVEGKRCSSFQTKLFLEEGQVAESLK